MVAVETNYGCRGNSTFIAMSNVVLEVPQADTPKLILDPHASCKRAL